MGIAAVLEENQRLRQLVEEREATLSERDAMVAERDAQIAALLASNEDLAQKLEMIRLAAMARKSQRLVDEGTEPLPFDYAVPPNPQPPPRLPVPETTTDLSQNDAEKSDNRGVQRRRNLAGRSDLPARPVKAKVDPASCCSRCGGAFKVIGVTTSYRLEWIPGHFERLDVQRERCVCPACPDQGVLIAPEPTFALPKALCGDGLLARVLVDKFVDHIPLNRQAERMAREGETFSTATLSSWTLSASLLLAPVVRAISTRLMSAAALLLDNTGLPVQDGTDGALRKGRLWVFTDQQEAVYTFTDTKEGLHPKDFLAKYTGRLILADLGSEFNAVVREKNLTRGGCWSHLRTYFFRARLYFPVEARLALGTIRDLFAIEASLANAPPERVLEVRQRDSKPLVGGLFAWIEGLKPMNRPTSLLGEAIQYALNNRREFEQFLLHPDLPLHNNLSELLLRQGVVGRKNWLFAGSEGGARAAATLYSLVGSCMLQGIDPWLYLRDVLGRLPDHAANRVNELTPMRWRLARERDGLPTTVGIQTTPPPRQS